MKSPNEILLSSLIMVSCQGLQRRYESFYMSNCPRPSQTKKKDIPNNQPPMRPMSFQGGSVVKERVILPSRKCRFDSWVSERYLGEGHRNTLQYSCLGNSMNREAWWATVHWVSKSWTQFSN